MDDSSGAAEFEVSVAARRYATTVEAARLRSEIDSVAGELARVQAELSTLPVTPRAARGWSV